VFAAALFVSAGALLWPAGWAFMALFFGFALAMVLWLAREDPELLAERLAPPIQRGQPPWDRAFVAAVLPLFLAWLIVMPLDAVRFGWSGVPGWLQLLGTVGLVLSFCLMFLGRSPSWVHQTQHGGLHPARRGRDGRTAPATLPTPRAARP
jgi:protein-S-isoprenylcysteine O-methyltransferase Ste14